MANKTTKASASTTAGEPTEEAFDPSTSNLVNHAKRELELAGIGDDDSDYGGAIAGCVIDLVTVFASQRHSGASAEITKQILLQLLNFEVLTPLTTDPNEWQAVSREMGFSEPVWQNKRAPAYFSKDGGKSWYHVETHKTGRSVTPKEIEDAKKKTTSTEVVPQEKSKTN